MKIEKLTKQQEIDLVNHREKWLSIGLSTDRVNRKTTEKVLTDFYRRINEETPQFWYCDSPLQAQMIMNLFNQDNLGANLGDNLWDNLSANLRDNLWDNLRGNLKDNLGDNLKANLWANLKDNLWNNLRGNLGDNLRDNLWNNLGANDLKFYPTYLWGSLDSNWIAYYLYPHQYLQKMHNNEDYKLLNQWADLAKSCFWWHPFKNICFVCEKPTLIKKDAEGRLHCEDGPAVSFLDSWNTYVWHGTNIPAEWIESDTLTPETALTWKNVEQRRAACEIIGWSEVLKQLNATVINKHENPQIGTLLEVDLPDSGKERFLQVTCGTGREFAIPVPPEMKTAMESQAWMNNETLVEFTLPAMRT